MSESRTLEAGDPAPDFTLPTGDGGQVSLSDFRGQREVVLYFYPRDDTPGCTLEACSFRDNLAALAERGAVVLGVSPDTARSHARFSEKFGLNFPLLADEGAKVSQAYGVWVQKSRYGRTYMGVERSTFLIGKDGRIRRIWRKVSPKGHAEEVLAALS